MGTKHVSATTTKNMKNIIQEDKNTGLSKKVWHSEILCTYMEEWVIILHKSVYINSHVVSLVLTFNPTYIYFVSLNGNAGETHEH